MIYYDNKSIINSLKNLNDAITSENVNNATTLKKTKIAYNITFNNNQSMTNSLKKSNNTQNVERAV